MFASRESVDGGGSRSGFHFALNLSKIYMYISWITKEKKTILFANLLLFFTPLLEYFFLDVNASFERRVLIEIFICEREDRVKVDRNGSKG